SDISEMLHRMAPLVNRHAPKGQAVDFTQVRPGEKGLSQLLKAKVDPFYRRALQGGAEPAGPEAPPQAEEADTSGLFGRLKRVFKG
ncbi:MAG: enhanced serine sensitivity protein SseB C-terminal domain-containing protein, partial [Candidatus Adiutrix sp.]|nr:enhanced serine sensitivity protein SseB C-terminal domain-containing protein [Candidatus Adiutrix sp.]